MFNPFFGANFKLRQCKVEGYPNYDKSVFMEPSAVASSDEEIIAIMEKQYPLDEFIDPKNFKSYDELAKKLASVLDTSGVSDTAQSSIGDDEEPEEPEEPPVKKENKRSPKRNVTVANDDSDDTGDDAALDYFRKIAAGDDDAPF